MFKVKFGWKEINLFYEENYLMEVLVFIFFLIGEGFVYLVLFKAGVYWLLVMEVDLYLGYCGMRLWYDSIF